MTRIFNVVPRAAINSGAWDKFVEESPEAWLFHTTLWQTASSDSGKDCSFGLADKNGVLRAIIGLQSGRIPGIRLAPFQRIYNFRSGLARAAGMTDDEKAVVDQEAIGAVQHIGRRRGALLVNWELPTMAPGPDLPSTSVLALNGFQVKSVRAKVIDLAQSEAAIWKEFRKGCKSVVKKAQREGVSVSCASSVADVETFSSLHADTMQSVGAQPRPKGHFLRLWNALSPEGHCEVLIARLATGLPVAGIMTISSKGTAYYHAAASAIGHRDAGGNTLLVHEAILRARVQGNQSFHLGPTPLREQVDEKTYLVGRFKNQFGGYEVPWRSATSFLWPGLAKARTFALTIRNIFRHTENAGLSGDADVRQIDR